MPAGSSCRSRSSFTCSPRKGSTMHLPLSRSCSGFATEPTLVRVEGHRWAIEDAFETAKTELGLTHNETRSWHGWHRHVSLVMLAFAMMAVVRERANTLTSPQKRNDEARLQRWYAGLSRKSAAWPHASSSIRSSLPS